MKLWGKHFKWSLSRRRSDASGLEIKSCREPSRCQKRRQSRWACLKLCPSRSWCTSHTGSSKPHARPALCSFWRCRCSYTSRAQLLNCPNQDVRRRGRSRTRSSPPPDTTPGPPSSGCSAAAAAACSPSPAPGRPGFWRWLRTLLRPAAWGTSAAGPWRTCPAGGGSLGSLRRSRETQKSWSQHRQTSAGWRPGGVRLWPGSPPCSAWCGRIRWAGCTHQ